MKKSFILKVVFPVLVFAAGLAMPFYSFAAQCVDFDTHSPVSSLPDGSCPPGSFSGATNQTSGPLTTVSALLARVENILNIIIPFLVGLAVFVIIYGLLRYVLNAADEEKRKEGKDFILWGVFGVFLMLSIWGLVTILVNSLPTDNSRDVVTRVYPTGPVPNLPPNDPTIIDFLQRVNAIGPYIIGFFFTIAFFIILIGILNYIKEGANEEKRAEARKFIIWGIVSLFIMLSIWGLTNVLVNSIQLNNQLPTSKIPVLPTIK